MSDREGGVCGNQPFAGRDGGTVEMAARGKPRNQIQVFIFPTILESLCGSYISWCLPQRANSTPVVTARGQSGSSLVRMPT